MKRNLILLLGAILVALVILEIVVRIFEIDHLSQQRDELRKGWVRVPEEVWTQYDSDLGWFHQKNKKIFPQNKVWLNLNLTTNRDGFRGSRNYLRKRTAGVKRVLLLGDSFVFGWGVGDEETFGAHLESNSQNLEAINLGVCAYGIDQILLSFQKLGRQFHPDYVFIGIYQEDFWRATRAFTDAGYAKPYFSLSKSGNLELHNVPSPKPFELRSNQFPEVIYKHSAEKILLQSVLYRVIKKSILKVGRDLNLLDPSLTDEWFLGRVILHKLVQEIHSINAEPVILIIPPKDWLQNTKPTSLQKSLRRFAEREKVDLIDLTPAFSNLVSKFKLTDYYIKDDWHWTAQGHRLAAQILISYLKEKAYLS